MKKVIAAIVVVLLAAGTLQAQTVLTYRNDPVVRQTLGSSPPSSVMVLDQTRRSQAGWWTVTPWNSLTVDWGYINAIDTNNMPDEVISGFTFEYVTNNTSADGMTYALLFWDQATGWADNARVQEWGVALSGLPNSKDVPGDFVSWTTNFDLAFGDMLFLFLLDKGDAQTAPRDGVQFGLWNLTTGWTPGAVAGWSTSLPPAPAGQNNSQSPDAVGVTSANYAWFGGYVPGGPGVGGQPFASMIWGLYGHENPAGNTKYTGIGQLTGNEASLYCVGDWAVGGNCHFMMRLNGRDETPSLVACVNPSPQYYPGLDVFKIFPIPIPWKQTMTPIDSPAIGLVGDYAIYDWTNLKAGVATKAVYFQGLITDKFNGGSTAPIDMTLNAVKTN